MLEYGIDVTSWGSRHFDTQAGRRFDYVITLCDKIREVCPEFYAGPQAIHWSIPDPAAAAMNELTIPRPIVVGVDGSKAAIRAALWAVDEAVSRDVPVRLLYAIAHGDTVAADSEAAARELATVETGVRRAVTAIEATGQSVRIETEITQGPAIGTSSSTTMLTSSLIPAARKTCTQSGERE